MALLLPLAFLTLSSAAPADATSAGASSAFRYSVRAGDTLWKIALRYDTTVDDLIQANRFRDPNLINIGQVIWVPGSNQAASNAVANASRVAPKYVFPIRNYRAKVPEHWGDFAGHRGAADLLAPEGTPIYAITSGRVISAGKTEMGGWNLMIQGDDGRQYYYAHFRQRALVNAGDYVTAGQHIAYVGNTGNSAAPHLHIAIGDQITLSGNSEGLRAGYGVSFDASAFLNKIR